MTGGFIKIAPSIGSECGADLARLNPLKANIGAGKAGIHPCDISKAIPGWGGREREMENAQFSAITRGYHNPKLLRSLRIDSISLLYRRVRGIAFVNLCLTSRVLILSKLFDSRFLYAIN